MSQTTTGTVTVQRQPDQSRRYFSKLVMQQADKLKKAGAKTVIVRPNGREATINYRA